MKNDSIYGSKGNAGFLLLDEDKNKGYTISEHLVFPKQLYSL